MIILIPMGGKGTRFVKAGYTINKASLLTTDRHTGNKLPMIVCAMKDMPNIRDRDTKIICVDRDIHERDGTERTIQEFFPQTVFIHDHIMLDQAYGCFLAREFLNTREELFIGACDNGFIYNSESFDSARNEFDVLMISHTNDANIERNPNAHSWAILKADSQELEAISLKKRISDNFMNDHATTGMFWFKRASDFLIKLERMIAKKDMFEGKYYVDKVLQYCIDSGYRVGVFDVRYICWGTPEDYEDYENTLQYWKDFSLQEGL